MDLKKINLTEESIDSGQIIWWIPKHATVIHLFILSVNFKMRGKIWLTFKSSALLNLWKTGAFEERMLNS